MRCLPYLTSHPAHLRSALPPPLPPAGGGRKKLKKRERDALLQQHGIALAGQLKGHGAEGPASRGGAGAAGANGSSGPASQEEDAAVAAAAAADAPPLPPAEDDDIFGDVGTDYVPTIKDKERMQQKAAAAAAEAGRRGGYFGDGEDLHADLPPLPKDGGWHRDGSRVAGAVLARQAAREQWVAAGAFMGVTAAPAAAATMLAWEQACSSQPLLCMPATLLCR